MPGEGRAKRCALSDIVQPKAGLTRRMLAQANDDGNRWSRWKNYATPPPGFFVSAHSRGLILLKFVSAHSKEVSVLRVTDAHSAGVTSDRLVCGELRFGGGSDKGAQAGVPVLPTAMQFSTWVDYLAGNFLARELRYRFRTSFWRDRNCAVR